jgi:GH35 family endo-1,4-beta-xylanase
MVLQSVADTPNKAYRGKITGNLHPVTLRALGELLDLWKSIKGQAGFEFFLLPRVPSAQCRQSESTSAPEPVTHTVGRNPTQSNQKGDKGMNKTIRSIFLLFALLTVVLSGCSPASTPVPSTFAPSPIPPTFSATISTAPTTTPTITPTPAPENLADANDLHVWIDDYVHAYGGIVTVNGIAKDANQVLGAVKANPGGFIEKKTIKGSETLFFVVNGVPLAIQNDGTWRTILARDISDAKNAQFAMPVLSFQLYNPNFVKVIKNANLLTIAWDLDTGQVFKTMTTVDWRNILNNWETIKTQLDSQQIPDGIPYNWTGADQVIKFAHDNHMGLRGRSLVWNGDVPDSIYNGGFTKAELLKILEFTISVKLMKYKGVIAEWDAEDELVITEFSTDKYGFWSKNVGILDATRLSARIIRKINPYAKITITDDHLLEERFYNLQPYLGIRFVKFLKTLKKEGLVDKVDIENNLWIYDLPDQEYMENFLRQIQAEGIELSAPEITVCPTKAYPVGPGLRQAYAIVDDPLKALAEGHTRVVQAYINVGAYDIGLGDVGDETSWYNYLSPGTNAALFDTQWKPKMGWYEILKVMYDGFIN